MKLYGGAILLLCAVWVHGLPNLHEVRSAISRAQEINAIKFDFEELNERYLGSSAARCPLARFHARRVSDSDDADRRNNDVMLAARILMKQGFTHDDLQHPLVLAEFTRQLGTVCPTPTVSCDNGAKYRTPDGSCNNENNPTWGMAGTAQRRVLPNAYDDGIGTPRSRGVNQNNLPNPRQVSNEVHRAARGPEVRSADLTLHTFQMGQFLDHDIIATPVQSVVTDCCSANNDVDNCININFNRNDPFHPMYINGYCMGVPRSSAVFCTDGSGNSVRQQTNDITSFIDASNVYGSSQAEMDELRDGSTGFLKTEGGVRLPNNPNNDACHSNVAEGVFCSLAGDFRVNVVPSLTSYHNLFVLEHNRIASDLDSQYTDKDILFQDVRRIIIAIMQKIVYDEFLPAFLSPAAMSKDGLSSSETYNYDATIDPTVANAFGIAYRMGHTWIPRDMSVFDRQLQPFVRRLTDETFEDPTLTYLEGDPSGMEGLAYWLSGANSPETDRVIEDQVRNRLFIDVAKNISFDLAALNIQRGRDHGLPSYNEYRKSCGLSAVEEWSDSAEELGLVDHDLNTIANLRRAGYNEPEDIDLFTGALTELPVDGGSLGPTLECILGDQFRRLKYGDRFWYQGSAAGFSTEQVEAIQSFTMSRLMCDIYDFDVIHSPNAFLSTNPRTSCNNITPLNVDVFRPVTTTAAPQPPSPRPPPPSGGGGGGNRNGSGGNRRPPQRDIDALLEKLIHELEQEDNDSN